jgi:hypothetical protein
MSVSTVVRTDPCTRIVMTYDDRWNENEQKSLRGILSTFLLRSVFSALYTTVVRTPRLIVRDTFNCRHNYPLLRNCIFERVNPIGAKVKKGATK